MRRLAILVLALASQGCATSRSELDNPWSRAQQPTRGPSFSVGGHSSGCLGGATSLPPDGKGYQLMRITRRRFYGHPSLTSYIEKLGARVSDARIGTLLIGDLSQPRGGPSLSGHRSHQTGLDADIWYWIQDPAKARSLTLDERESLGAPSMVVESGIAGAPFAHPDLWTKKHSEMLRVAASFEEVDRIFVSASIKRELCIHLLEGDRAWLRKIRPWFGHVDHFHVRLRCPADSGTECAAQDPIPEGDGCDDTLNWWFSEEALAKARTEKTGTPELPKLPERCGSLIE